MNTKMRQFVLAILLCVSILSYNRIAFGWGSSGGDGTSYQQMQETAVFLNNSGSTMTVGQLVVLDTFNTGVATGTTLGSYVTTPVNANLLGAKADSILNVGVVKSTSVATGLPVVVVTKGPVSTLCDDSSDAVTIRTAVGVSGLNNSNNCGGGTNLGIALEAGSGSDGASIIVWVDPTGAD